MKANKLDLNINALVSKLTNLFKCGKNSVYKSSSIALRLVQSAVHNQSLEAMYKLTGVLSADRMLDRVKEIDFETVDKLIKQENKKLKLPKQVSLAVDFNEKEYYGDKNHFDVIGSKGGKYVRKYAELSCISPPLFLKSRPINQFNNSTHKVVKDFIDDFKTKHPKSNIKEIFVDRAFFNKKVIQYLVENNVPFVMPAIKDKAISKLVAQFKEEKLKSKIKYKFGEVTITLAFVKVKDEIYVYATNTNYTPVKLMVLYTKRWQIETNFREQNKFSIKTTTTNFKIRYLIFVLAGLLFNAWQLTRSKYKHIQESYLYKQVLIEEILKNWQKTTRRVIKKIDYFLLA
jgi:hypothetical protein